MNIAEFSIRNNVITITLTLMFIVAGIFAYGKLSRLEDPEFTIKEAVVTTPYPGASAEEVEQEVSNVIEKACQELGELMRVESFSERGMSTVKVTIKDQYDKKTLPQVWDLLRRKVNDYQSQLPPGAGPSLVNDDFGDVYGVYFALSGNDFSYSELNEYADFLQRELLTVQDVKKITLYGKQQEVVYVEISRTKMAQLGISPDEIFDTLKAKNLAVDSGRINIDTEYVPITPTGEFKSEQQFGNLLISSKTPDKLIFLKDVAKIRRGYKEPADTILRVKGNRAIGIGISTIAGGNVVRMGEALKRKLVQLLPLLPIGLEFTPISIQSDTVNISIKGFVINLIEAVLIVFVVLLIFMGMKSGIIIGFVLLLTICMTLFIMDAQHIIMERISLGALIIALGMLVDNAIVITESMQIQIEKGMDGLESAKQTVTQTQIPLLGATFIAVIAFASIGLSQDSTGEYCRSLFQVILISLMLSWVTAITTTPFLCNMMFKKKKNGTKSTDAEYDPYGGLFFRVYKKMLVCCINYRWLTMAVALILFTASIIGFGFVKQMFFPPSTRDQFFVDLRFPENTKIEIVENELKKAEDYLLKLNGVKSIATTIGGGQIRFLLTYTPESKKKSFGQIIVTVDDYKKIDKLSEKAQNDLEALFPDAIVNAKKFMLGPSKGGKIQLRIYGDNYDRIREIANKALAVLYNEPLAKGVYYDWNEKVKVIKPQLLESQAINAGITRPDLAVALQSCFSGTIVGVYREEDDLLPIIARSPEEERQEVDNIYNLLVYSSVSQGMIPMGQVVSDFTIEFENSCIGRRNRVPTLTIHFDPRTGLSAELLKIIKPKIEKALNVDVESATGKKFAQNENPFDDYSDKTIALRYDDHIPIKGMQGYSIAWGGENEDSVKAQMGLAKSLPGFGVLMVLIVIFLFNSLKKTAIIWLCVPLAIIGVTAGLLMFNQPFGFMALLGLMSLSGMLIKNAIVLIDQIDFELKSGKKPFDSIVDSGVSRMRPVMMASLTTILGMMPLLTDSFFISMAVTIMFGLGFATILTLIIVPTLYAIFYSIKQ